MITITTAIRATRAECTVTWQRNVAMARAAIRDVERRAATNPILAALVGLAAPPRRQRRPRHGHAVISTVGV